MASHKFQKKKTKGLFLSLLLGMATFGAPAYAGIFDRLFKRTPPKDSAQCEKLVTAIELNSNPEVLSQINELGLSARMNDQAKKIFSGFREGLKINAILYTSYSASDDSNGKIDADIKRLQQEFKGVPFLIGVMLPSSSPSVTFYVSIRNLEQRNLFLRKFSENPEIRLGSTTVDRL